MSSIVLDETASTSHSSEIEQTNKEMHFIDCMESARKVQHMTKFSLLGNAEEEKILASTSAEDTQTDVEAGRADGDSRRTDPGRTEVLEGTNSGASINTAPCALEHSQSEKKPTKDVKEYYKKQNTLLENFQSDQEQIQESQKIRTHARLQQVNSKNRLADQEDASARTTAIEYTIADDDVIVTTKRKKRTKPIAVYGDVEKGTEKEELIENKTAEEHESAAASRLATITLFVNVSLMIAKAVASSISGSMSIVSSLIDSIVDITSGLLIYLTTKAIRKKDPYAYPRGKTRLEPITLICISVIMGFASVQMLVETVKKVINDDLEVTMGYPSALIMVATIVVKGVLLFICRSYPNDASVQVLAMDHRNDCLSNTVALICSVFTPLPGTAVTFFGTPGWKYLDPIGAVLVCLYIINTWLRTGKDHVMMLAGKSADPEFINRIIKVCIDHDERIEHIDTVYVYHYGMKFLVEVHVVMDASMPHKEAHDISESLQTNIESLPDVERAFVHTDYEYAHHPKDEHKVV